MRNLHLFFIAIFALFLPSITYGGGEAASSSQAFSSESEKLVVPTSDQILEHFQNCTEDNLIETLDKYGPNAVLFKVRRLHIKNQNRKKSRKKNEEEKIVETFFVNYYIWSELVLDSAQLEGDSKAAYQEQIKYFNEIIKECMRDNDMKKRLHKKTIKNVNSLIKYFDYYLNRTNIDVGNFLSKKLKNKADKALEKFRESVRGAYLPSHSETIKIPFQTKFYTENPELAVLGAHFGCPEAIVIITELSEKNLTIKSPERLTYTAALRFGYLRICRTNYAITLIDEEQDEEAKIWLTFAAEEGDECAKAQLQALKHQKNDQKRKVKIVLLKEKSDADQLEDIAVDQLTQNGAENDALNLLRKNATEGNVRSMSILILKLIDKRHLQEAKKWSLVLAENGFNKYYSQAGHLAWGQQKYREAVKYYELLNQENRRKVAAIFYIRYSNCLRHIGKYDEALVQILQAVELGHLNLLTHVANIQFEIGNRKDKNDLDRFNDAKETCNRSLHNESQNENPSQSRKATSYGLLGAIARAEGDAETSKAHFLRAYQLGDKLAGSNYGRALCMEGNFEEGLSLMKDLFKNSDLTPYNARATQFNIGNMMYLKIMKNEDVAPATEDELKEALLWLMKAYKAHIKETCLMIAELKVKLEDATADDFFKKAIKHGISGAEESYALYLDSTNRFKEASNCFDYLAADEADDDLSHSDDDDYDSREKDFQDYVEPKDTKRYKRMLAKAKKAQTQQTSSLSLSVSADDVEIRTYKDLNISLYSPDLQSCIDEHKVRIQRLLTSLANNEPRGKFEKLVKYDHRFSMRITKSHRLVFDIVEGSLNDPEGIKAIVIVAASKHYTNLPALEHTETTGIKVKWSDDENSE